MKKMAMVLGAAALAALVSCGVAELPQEVETLQEAVQYTADGQRLVNLSIPTGAIGASRSLTADLAVAAADYYEVVFKKGANYYRTAGIKGRTLKISVPEGDYDNTTNKAVIFAGTSDEKTLLAVGTITAVNGVEVGVGGSITIDGATTSVTFTLTPLKAEIYNARESAFQVTYPSYKTTTNDNHHTIVIGGKNYPFFKIPAGTEEITAQLTIAGLPDTNLVFATAAPQLNNASVIHPATSKVLVGLTQVSTIAAGTVLKNSRTVRIKISTKVDTAKTDGWAAISFDIPVIAIDPGANGDQWHVRSGISYALDGGGPDVGKSPGSCILLQVGNPGTVDITITQ